MQVRNSIQQQFKRVALLKSWCTKYEIMQVWRVSTVHLSVLCVGFTSTSLFHRPSGVCRRRARRRSSLYQSLHAGSSQVLSLMALIVLGNGHLLSSSLFFGCAGESLPLSLKRHLALLKYAPPNKTHACAHRSLGQLCSTFMKSASNKLAITHAHAPIFTHSKHSHLLCSAVVFLLFLSVQFCSTFSHTLDPVKE